ncbi:MAG: type IV toxin-antitoxin system AbiEi family antitoxin [Bacteroidia bacterium]|nr:type IV toxin-antitoxin system AbiEi family antitoxin [Bacteroidia bacterium]
MLANIWIFDYFCRKSCYNIQELIFLTTKRNNMTVSEFIREREIRGQVTFPLNEVREATGLSAKTVITELQRQASRGRITIPYRGFYVVVPPQYALKGIVPPTYYIHELMKVVGKPYYVCLLSAAAFHGAAHQRAMQTQVMTVAPRIKPSGMNAQLNWNYRQQIPQELLLSRNTEMGIVLYSNAELTAVDLVQFAGHIGGLQRAATVLSELSETIDIAKMEKVFPYTSSATLQRLGYLLEFVLEQYEQADKLYELLKASHPHLKSIMLNNTAPDNPNATANRWHVAGNIEIEIDEI